MNLFDLQRVVVPVDFSAESLAAVREALELVRGDASKIYVVHVLAEMSPADPGVVWGEISDENRAEHVRDALRQSLPGPQLQPLHLEVVFGDAGFRIAEFAERIGADLIVIPSHGRTGIQHLLIGSVAERVIRYAHCPVLVLRNQRNRLEP